MSNEEMDFTDPKVLRQKAEEQLKEDQKKQKISPSEGNIERLVQELQVHQIELEMQNEELKKAYTTAETALKKYTMLYDLAPMGYFTLDADGHILDLNFTGAELLRDKRISLIDANFKLFISSDSRSEFNNFFQSLYITQEKKSCKVQLSHNENELCHVYMEGVVLGDDKYCLLSVINISDFTKK